LKRHFELFRRCWYAGFLESLKRPGDGGRIGWGSCNSSADRIGEGLQVVDYGCIAEHRPNERIYIVCDRGSGHDNRANRANEYLS
jgi:hypothetical protein